MRLGRLYKGRIGGSLRLLRATKTKDKKTVSSIAVFNSEGQMLWGLRNDDEKWTMPGGHAEEGEDPRDAAIRELWEESSLKVDEVEFLGDGYGGRDGNIHVFCYKAIVDGDPSSDNDPDGECSVWSWVDVSDGVPDVILDNLHNKKNITLEHLKLDKRAQVNIVDEPLDTKMDLSMPSRSPSGEEMQDNSIMHPEDTQKNASAIQPLPPSMVVDNISTFISELYGSQYNDEWTGQVYRSGPEHSDRPTYYHTNEDGASYYSQIHQQPVSTRPSPSGQAIYIDIDDETHIDFISTLLGYPDGMTALNNVGDVALLIEQALSYLRSYGIPYLIINGATGAEVTGTPIEIVKLANSSGVQTRLQVPTVELMTSLHNVDENINEDPDLKLGEVEAPYSSGNGPMSTRFDDDKKYTITVGASIKMSDLFK